ncbi:hypothetical protein [Amycolatopsis sp. NPDC051128]|uniref:hypothetical protein n=1 Tax=Amycolatopsis sp. NPDC051128 TaxID=3155412 RepID=UPI003438F8AA
MHHEQHSSALRGASKPGPGERRARSQHTFLSSQPLALGSAAVVGLQRSVGNAVVSRMIGGPPADLQRACGPGCTDCSACAEKNEDELSAQRVPEVQRDGEASEGDPSLVAKLEREIEAVTRDAEQDGDLGLRANANRASLLLRFRAHPRFETPAQVDEFIDRARQLARTEMDTLTALGPAGAELAMATTPKGFPLTWSGRVHAALTLGIDPAAALAELQPKLAALTTQANELPPRLVDKGLPVPLAELAGLSRFGLRLAHAQLPAGEAVGDFARATARWAQLRFYGNFALTWEGIVNQVAEAVADGTYVPKFHDYQDFVQNKQRILRDLPTRSAERLAMSEAELQAIQTESLGLADAALLAGMGGGLSALLGILSGWSQGSDLFDTALAATDARIGGAGDGERVAMAFRWLLAAGYAGGAMGEVLDGLIANGPEILKELAVIVVLQMIPFVDVAVDVYLMVKLGADVLSQLVELGDAFRDVLAARTAVAMQHAAGRMARVLAAGGSQILLQLATMGVARGVRALRARSERIRAANPALSEEQAMRQAMREAPKAERAPLEATLSPWEQSLNEETQALLRERPDLRRQFREMDPRVRDVLTRCASPCIPTTATTAQVQTIQSLLARLRNLNATDELLLKEHFHAGRADLDTAISRVSGASTAAHLRKLLRESAVDRSSVPKVLAPLTDVPGHGFPGRWGDPASPSYGHSYREHGAHLDSNDFRNRAMSVRKSGRRVPDGQFYDNALIVEAERRAPATPGAHDVDMFRAVGRVFQPDGSVVSDVQRVRVVRLADGSIESSFPIL